MSERRSALRWRVNQQAKIKLEGAQAYAGCQIKDINFKGLQIVLGLRLPKDTVLKFSLFLAEGFTLNIEAWAVWHKTVMDTNIYGLYFSKIPDIDKEKIYKFMRSNFPEQIDKQWWEGLREEKGGETMEDRRIFARLPVRFPLRYFEHKSGQEGQAHTQDISAKGIGLVGNKELAPQTSLEIWVEVPDKGEPLYTRGEVVWSKELEPNLYQAGVNLEKADLMGLSRVLRAA
jgi:hypothetical protein